ncbi:MAG: type II secretion system protein [Rhodospirillales bacterium]|nr:type II secretion system protein [Rhodospirillales bacterium]
MRVTLKEKHVQQQGFTLLEMAVAILIVGILAVPAISLYSLYIQDQKTTQTEGALTRSTGQLASYRSLHGRYPCPAPVNAQPGDLNYGYEDCTPNPPGIVSVTNPDNGRDILIGSIPFRELGLPESETVDGYGGRLTYAVTALLTVDTTFDARAGAIDIVDVNDDSVITPADSGHFVVISHNKNNDGAWSRGGAQIGACPAGLENENCDLDAVFRKVSLQSDFDDRVFYAVTNAMSEWQIASTAGFENDIHLRSANNFVVGLNSAVDDPTGFGTVDIRKFAGEVGLSSAGMLIESGMTESAELCRDSGGVDCFAPEVIYGVNPGEGMDCGNDYLVGVENGGPVCRSQVSFECPPGDYLVGINGDGTLKCNTLPAGGCPAATITTSCGTSRNIAAAADGNYSYAYSGTCHPAAQSNATVVSNVDAMIATGLGNSDPIATIKNDIKTYLDGVNAMPRGSTDCGPTAPTAQVRDAFRCESGSWGPHTPFNPLYTSEMAHERMAYGSSFVVNPVDTGGARPAEVGNNPYVAGMDPYNAPIIHAHDCWCREDFRIETESCGSGYSGSKFKLYKYRCPQTADINNLSNWTNIPLANGDMDCACVPGSGVNVNWKRCYEFFGVPSDGTPATKWARVSGWVDRTWNRACPLNYTYTYDKSDCACHVVTQYKPGDPCPAGFSNSFTYSGVPYTDVQNVKGHTWNCPTGDGGAVNNAAQAGSWSAWTTAFVGPACSCDPTKYISRFENCPPTESGPPNAIEYRKYMDCTKVVPDYEDNWQLHSNACTACSWQHPPGFTDKNTAGVINLDTASSCNCGDGPVSCYKPTGLADPQYRVWSSCRCLP